MNLNLYKYHKGKEMNTDEVKQAILLNLKALKAQQLIEQIMSVLNTKEQYGCDFTNGGGWIQHHSTTFDMVFKKLYEAACEYHKGLPIYEMGSAGFGRFLDDSSSPFNRPFARWYCTDLKTYKEYGQQFFKLNPDECTEGQLNTFVNMSEEAVKQVKKIVSDVSLHVSEEELSEYYEEFMP